MDNTRHPMLPDFVPESPNDCYFIHDGYDGWSYGTPMDPTPITLQSALELMRITGLTRRDTIMRLPPAQFAEHGDMLFEATGGNRFLAYGNPERCSRGEGYQIPEPIDLTDVLRPR